MAGLIRQLELDWRLLLPHGCPVHRVTVWVNVLDPYGHDVTAAKLAVNRQVKQGEVIRPSNSNRVLIDQTCFGRKGGLAPISLPLFQGVSLLVGAQFSLSDMILLRCYEEDEHAPARRLCNDVGFQSTAVIAKL